MLRSAKSVLILGATETAPFALMCMEEQEIAGIKLERTHKLDAPKGVNGRNSDNTMIQDRLGWAPGIKLRDGMEKTYNWIEAEYLAKYGSKTQA